MTLLSKVTKIIISDKGFWKERKEKRAGAFSDYFIFIVFPLPAPEYGACIMPALGEALQSLPATCFNKAIFSVPESISGAAISTETEYDTLSQHTCVGQDYTLLKEKWDFTTV